MSIRSSHQEMSPWRGRSWSELGRSETCVSGVLTSPPPSGCPALSRGTDVEPRASSSNCFSFSIVIVGTSVRLSRLKLELSPSETNVLKNYPIPAIHEPVSRAWADTKTRLLVNIAEGATLPVCTICSLSLLLSDHQVASIIV